MRMPKLQDIFIGVVLALSVIALSCSKARSDVITKPVIMFTYGTLQRGERLHPHWLGDSERVRFLGRDMTEEAAFDIASVPGAWYPYVMAVDTEGVHIAGEVFEVAPDIFDSIASMEMGAGYSVTEVSLASGLIAQMFTRPASPVDMRDRTHIQEQPSIWPMADPEIQTIRGWSTQTS